MFASSDRLCILSTIDKHNEGRQMTNKQKLAATYGILKYGVWKMAGVSEQNNSKQAHYKRAMTLMNMEDIEVEIERLTAKLAA